MKKIEKILEKGISMNGLNILDETMAQIFQMEMEKKLPEKYEANIIDSGQVCIKLNYGYVMVSPKGANQYRVDGFDARTSRQYYAIVTLDMAVSEVMRFVAGDTSANKLIDTFHYYKSQNPMEKTKVSIEGPTDTAEEALRELRKDGWENIDHERGNMITLNENRSRTDASFSDTMGGKRLGLTSDGRVAIIDTTKGKIII